MVIFKVTGKHIEYSEVVLNGVNFYLKAQEVIFGKNQYKSYPTIIEELKNLKIEITHFNVPIEEVNNVAFLERIENNKNSLIHSTFNSIYNNTLKKNYQKYWIKESKEIYENMYKMLDSKLFDIIYNVIFKNVTPDWVAARFKIDIDTVMVVLETLPSYYNFLKEEEEWLTYFQ